MSLRSDAIRNKSIPLCCLALAACVGPFGTGGGTRATATLQPTRGNFALGTATFTQQGDTVIVFADIRGLPPSGQAGFHVHEKGDCSSSDGMSAGGHYNPLKKNYGHETAERHVGDMPNLKADATGRALYRAKLDVVTVADGPNSIVGRALIVHLDPDDYTTQPSGNSSPRIACGVIQRTG
jgi:superoxide dismutase, Cu-Zn family